MKVLQIVQSRQRRGAEVFAHDLSQELRRRGSDVRTIYLYRVDGHDLLSTEPADICLDGMEQASVEESLGLHPRVLWGLLREIKEFKPEVVQVNGSNTVKYGAAAKFLSPGASWALVYRNIGFPSHWNGSRFKRLVYRRGIMTRVDGVAGVSKATLQDAVQLYRMKVPTTVIGNAVNPQRMRPSASRAEVRERRGVGRHDIVLLFLGALAEVKRPDRFLRVLAEASKKNATLRGWVVGDGPLDASSKDLAHQLGLESRCEFFGSREDVADFLLGADILLLTSESEGIPAVVLEAGYMGLPAIASDLGGLNECIVHGKTGMLIESESEEAFVEAVIRLSSNSELCRELGQAAQAYVLHNFSLGTVAERFEAFYSNVRK